MTKEGLNKDLKSCRIQYVDRDWEEHVVDDHSKDRTRVGRRRARRHLAMCHKFCSVMFRTPHHRVNYGKLTIAKRINFK